MTGYLAVEIFFVLSGFLIGKILIKEVYESSTLFSIRRFYLRRWFRTLPLYFLIFAVTFLLGGDPHWLNILFLQNYKESALNFMPVSWSLSVEEWFYFSTPIFFVLISKSTKVHNRKRIFILICVFLMLISFIIRCKMVFTTNPTWDYGVRKQIFLRMDSLKSVPAGSYY